MSPILDSPISTNVPESTRITRPLRPPHHTTSDAGIVGDGSTPAQGEISLAYHGVK
jgi:magnesium chelatase family protein